ncbi:dihydrofolate reductase family protein [Pseudalkalibacillus salsuginis]|uniref:dihydrofolate reductase family protein n=1 Tax=Pseudalkalibacillus salsuginis TaxID=2910972 RepID=UPI001F4882CD|nr:dihydrofolate reductase family protein [Pseudalkalibacillus salsuginis]MCF6411424.1 dihydrofolate reductase family protein [Pseudalkalibacillus salsuginis]
MRKLTSFLHVSLDGYVQGTQDWDLNWIPYDGEMAAYADETVSTADTVLWGRSTYQGMQEYWTTVPGNPEATEHDKKHAEWINKAHKVVFSSTLEKAEWNNSTLVKDNAAQAVLELKQQTGQDMVILGSPRFTRGLIQLGLIDEFRLNVAPVVLGQGLPLFEDMKDQIDLELVSNKTFRNGVVGLIYRPKKS